MCAKTNHEDVDPNETWFWLIIGIRRYKNEPDIIERIEVTDNEQYVKDFRDVLSNERQLDVFVYELTQDGVGHFRGWQITGEDYQKIRAGLLPRHRP